MNRDIEIYNAFISAYITRDGDNEHLTPHEQFVLNLHQAGINKTLNEAKAYAYEIVYSGVELLEGETDV